MINVAVVVSKSTVLPGVPIPGTVAQLMDINGVPLCVGTVNHDGYVLFPNAPNTFTGTLILTGAAQYYEQPVSWGAGAHGFTLRVGVSQPFNPGDIQLPAAVPFV